MSTIKEVFREDIDTRNPIGYYISAVTGSGKTSLIRCLIDNLRHRFSVIAALVPLNNNNDFKIPGVIERMCQSKVQTEEVLLDAINHQTEKIRKNEKLHPLLIIIDDFSSLFPGRSAQNSEALITICTRGRHLNISYIFSGQSFKMCPPIVRDNVSKMIFARNMAVELRDLKGKYDIDIQRVRILNAQLAQLGLGSYIVLGDYLPSWRILIMRDPKYITQSNY